MGAKVFPKSTLNPLQLISRLHLDSGWDFLSSVWSSGCKNLVRDWWRTCSVSGWTSGFVKGNGIERGRSSWLGESGIIVWQSESQERCLMSSLRELRLKLEFQDRLCWMFPYLVWWETRVYNIAPGCPLLWETVTSFTPIVALQCYNITTAEMYNSCVSVSAPHC